LQERSTEFGGDGLISNPFEIDKKITALVATSPSIHENVLLVAKFSIIAWEF
jgi:hypothetical protein